MPDGPGAAPRRALLKQIKNSTMSSLNCSVGRACHCSAQLLPWQWRSLLRVNQCSKGCHVAWGHGRTFKRLSRNRQFAHLYEGQGTGGPLPFIIMLLTTPPANRLSMDPLSTTGTFGKQFQPQTSLKRGDSRLQLRVWDRTSPTWSKQNHPGQVATEVSNHVWPSPHHSKLDPARISCNASWIAAWNAPRNTHGTACINWGR